VETCRVFFVDVKDHPPAELLYYAPRSSIDTYFYDVVMMMMTTTTMKRISLVLLCWACWYIFTASKTWAYAVDTALGYDNPVVSPQHLPEVGALLLCTSTIKFLPAFFIVIVIIISSSTV
jgi:hypothetical protein